MTSYAVNIGVSISGRKHVKTMIHKHRKKALIAGVALMAACAVVFWIHSGGDDSISYAQEKAKTVEMEKTVTAAGELRQYKSKKQRFDTDLTFQAMCVEVGDAVEKGDPLIQYSDGSFSYAKGSGVVTAIQAPDTGDTPESSHYVKVAYTDNMTLKITVTEDQISQIEKGDKAKVVVNVDTGKSYTGIITSVKALPDEESGGYTVKIRLKNDGSLKIGMSANCTITVSSRSDVLAVPIQAVMFNEKNQPYVNVSENGKVIRKTVKTGESDANNVEITKGLTEGDVILVEENDDKDR
jgi:multidrug efflux pump subunit AcrA (membrane-fusion protein)